MVRTWTVLANDSWLLIPIGKEDSYWSWKVNIIQQVAVNAHLAWSVSATSSFTTESPRIG